MKLTLLSIEKDGTIRVATEGNITTGDFEAGANEARDVAVGGVIGDAAHGNGLALFAIAGGEGDLELAGGDDGVFVEEFVEVAKAEEKEGVGVAGFDRVVLLHEGCGGFGHGEVISKELSAIGNRLREESCRR